MSDLPLPASLIPGTEADPIGTSLPNAAPISGGADQPITSIPPIGATVTYQGQGFIVQGQQSDAVTGDSVLLPGVGWVNVNVLGQ